MSTNFLSVPSELHIRILSNLNAVSLVSCAMTCTCLYDTFKNSSELTYIIELHLNGLKDAGTSVPAADSIALLRRRREAWMSLEWMKHPAIEIRHDEGVYDLIGGVFAHVTGNTLEIVQLPNSRNTEARTGKRDLNEMAISCLTMDPTQDLIVLLEDVRSSPAISDARIAHVHIRAISADAPHPFALQSALRFDVGVGYGIRNRIGDPVLQVADEILALFYSTRKDMRALIWDWRTSELLLDSDISFNGSFRTRLCCLSLLNSTHLVSASSDDSGSIQLYKIERSRSVENCPGVHLATLHLPALFPCGDHSKILHISMQAGPILAHSILDSPFMTNNEDRLLVFWITYKRIGSDGYQEYIDCASMFVHQRVFMEYVSRHASLEGPPLDIPWREWGPSNTCLIFPRNGSGNSHTRRHIDGQRVVLSHRTGFGASLLTSIEILDFSRAATFSLSSRRSAPWVFSTKCDNWKLSRDNWIATGGQYSPVRYPYFKGEVCTHLPYAHITRELGLESTEFMFMVCADNVVGVKGNDDPSLSSHVYTI